MSSRDVNMKHSLQPEKLRTSFEVLSKSFNIKQWDIGATSTEDISVQVDRGETKQLKASQRNSVTIRVWNTNGIVGISSTSDMTESGLKKGLISAYNASNYGNQNEIPAFSPLAKSPLPKSRKPVKEQLGISSLIDILKNAEDQLIKSHEHIESVPYNGLSELAYERIYINSEGANRHISSTQSSLYLYARAIEKNRKPRSAGAIRLAYGTKDLDINGCIEEVLLKTVSHLNYKPIKTGKYLVCFSPEAFLDLINSFSNIFNARSILDGVSLSKVESIGEKISVPFLSIYDDGLHPSNIGSTPFDGEGTPTQKLCLVKEGKLVNLIHSEATARKLGVTPTGHAGSGAKVSVGTDWLVIKSELSVQDSGAFNHEQFQDTYVLVDSLNALHAGIKSTQGSFSLPFDGWMISKGERVSIEAATIAGDIKELLNNIINIEHKSFETHQGVSPHVWIEGLTITGER